MNALRHDSRGKRAGGIPRRLRPSFAVGLAVAIGLVASLPACGIGFNPSSATESGGVADGASLSVDAGVAIDAAKVLAPAAVYADGGAADVIANGGTSPLCGALAMVQAPSDAGTACDPDDTKSCTPTPVGTLEPDAGIYTDDEGGVRSFGCHVTATHVEAGAASAMTTCSPAMPDGTEDAPCYASSDCAAGFECVVDAARSAADGAAGAAGGVCRAYCCDNMCDQSGDLRGSFCDIETTVGGAVAVPVCVVSHAAPASGDAGPACELLNGASSGAGSCAMGLTCQVVNQFTGQVACVTPGSATAGESCESSKCAKGLSCILGYFPARECAQLCLIGNNDCPAGEACTANAGISSVDSQIGTCSP